MDISTQIINVINEIALKLGVAAEKVYPVLRKQAYVEGMINILQIVLLAIVVGLIVKVLTKNYSEWIKNDNPLFFIFVALLVVFSTFLLCETMFDAKRIITSFVNPDWYIFNNLLKNIIK